MKDLGRNNFPGQVLSTVGSFWHAPCGHVSSRAWKTIRAVERSTR